MTTALSATGVPARAQTRALHLHPRAPLLRCRLKRVTNVRKILVTAAPVSSGAAANSQPDCLKAAGPKTGPPFRCRIAQKHVTRLERFPQRCRIARCERLVALHRFFQIAGNHPSYSVEHLCHTRLPEFGAASLDTFPLEVNTVMSAVLRLACCSSGQKFASCGTIRGS